MVLYSVMNRIKTNKLFSSYNVCKKNGSDLHTKTKTCFSDRAYFFEITGAIYSNSERSAQFLKPTTF